MWCPDVTAETLRGVHGTLTGVLRQARAGLDQRGHRLGHGGAVNVAGLVQQIGQRDASQLQQVARLG